MAGEPLLEFVQRQDFVQFQFDDFFAADDAERQRQGEDQARFGMEALGVAERQGGAAQHALEGAHQVVMAEQTQVAALAEADANLVANGERGSASEQSGVGRAAVSDAIAQSTSPVGRGTGRPGKQ